MKCTVHFGNESFAVFMDRATPISIPLRFDGPQPNSYDVPHATSRAYEDGGFIGDTRRGGGCNFETVQLTPHCNGTHTECVGHISDARLSVEELVPPGLLPATLISVTPEQALFSSDSYFLLKEEDDFIITAHALRSALAHADPHFLEALVIRTLPNDASKCSRRYTEKPPPFLSIEAVHTLNAFGIEHLLVDIPSLDRAMDEGRLSAHHLFWDVPQGSHEVDPASPSRRSITEMIFVPDTVKDGKYMLDLQIAPFVSDAAPSRPVLFPIQAIENHAA
ncbi:cyclase family protein [bacterium]|nr:cyclase family protein [bacterium]